jgi:hypothetical protein
MPNGRRAHHNAERFFSNEVHVLEDFAGHEHEPEGGYQAIQAGVVIA